MIRNIFLIFSMLILLLFQNAFKDNLSIKPNIPGKVFPGAEFVVELTINKGDMKGFAMLTHELPEGFIVTALESKNASFSFSEKKVKFIWIELPKEQEFIVSYKVKLDASVSGLKSINGTFSYLMDSDKKVYNIPSAQILVSQNELAQSSEENKDVITKQPTEQTITDEATKTTSISQANNVSAVVECKRVIDHNAVSKGEFIVEVIINKSEIGEFAKLQEVLPEGFSATPMEVSDAQFAFSSRVVKFVWLNLPAKNEIKVSYKVKTAPGIAGEYFINGEFSYVEKDGETKKFILPKEKINVSQKIHEEIALDNEKTKIVDKPHSLTSTSSAKKTSAETTADSKKPKTPDQPKSVTSTPSPQNGINYKVQIAAGSKPVSDGYFTKKYGIKEPVYNEMHQGLYKYALGNFPEYGLARDKRESAKSEFNINTGLFVIAYNNGQRITVQEALMISNQKWIK